MAANKVIYGGKTLIDLTRDTVNPDTLADGVTAHNAAGVSITGTGAFAAGGVLIPPLVVTGEEPMEECSALFAEITNAFNGGRQVLYKPYERTDMVCYISQLSTKRIVFVGVAANNEIIYNVLTKSGWFSPNSSAGDIQLLPEEVTGTGAINKYIYNNNEYSFTDVTSLTMKVNAVKAHGFVTFAATTPTINVTGFTKTSGDNINSAKASQIWEFSVSPYNGGGYITWKNWGV